MLAEGALRIGGVINGNIGESPSKDTEVVDGHAASTSPAWMHLFSTGTRVWKQEDILVHPWHLNTQRQFVALTELERVVKVA